MKLKKRIVLLAIIAIWAVSKHHTGVTMVHWATDQALERLIKKTGQDQPVQQVRREL